MFLVRKLRGHFFGPADLQVAPGQCIAIRGASGCGKTVLLRAIVDLDPNEGDVSWRQQGRDDMPAPEWRRLVGFVPAETGWWADSVAAHFEPGPGADGLLEAVGLPIEAMQWDVARLSTGERHRLGLVRALDRKPEVLLLDEPTASLDEDATSRVEELLVHQLAADAAIILVTHDPEQARRLASRTLMMEGGILSEIPASGP